ncbi:Vacuolar protein sorting-associated protein 51 [Glycine soja]
MSLSLSPLTFSLSSQHKPYHRFANPFMVEILSPNLAKGLGNKLGYWLYCEGSCGLGFGDESEFQGSGIANARCFKAEGATIWGLRASVMKENEGELALFLEMKKHEKECNDLLLNCSEEFNAPLGSILRNYIGLVIFFVKFRYQLLKQSCMFLYSGAQMKYLFSLPLYQAYGDSSFRDCKQAFEEVIVVVVKNLHGKLFSDFESIQVRADATVLLKQLDFSVCTSFLKK